MIKHMLSFSTLFLSTASLLLSSIVQAQMLTPQWTAFQGFDIEQSRLTKVLADRQSEYFFIELASVAGQRKLDVSLAMTDGLNVEWRLPIGQNAEGPIQPFALEAAGRDTLLVAYNERLPSFNNRIWLARYLRNGRLIDEVELASLRTSAELSLTGSYLKPIPGTSDFVLVYTRRDFAIPSSSTQAMVARVRSNQQLSWQWMAQQNWFNPAGPASDVIVHANRVYLSNFGEPLVAINLQTGDPVTLDLLSGLPQQPGSSIFYAAADTVFWAVQDFPGENINVYAFSQTGMLSIASAAALGADLFAFNVEPTEIGLFAREGFDYLQYTVDRSSGTIDTDDFAFASLFLPADDELHNYAFTPGGSIVVATEESIIRTNEYTQGARLEDLNVDGFGAITLYEDVDTKTLSFGEQPLAMRALSNGGIQVATRGLELNLYSWDSDGRPIASHTTDLLDFSDLIYLSAFSETGDLYVLIQSGVPRRLELLRISSTGRLLNSYALPVGYAFGFSGDIFFSDDGEVSLLFYHVGSAQLPTRNNFQFVLDSTLTLRQIQEIPSKPGFGLFQAESIPADGGFLLNGNFGATTNDDLFALRRYDRNASMLWEYEVQSSGEFVQFVSLHSNADASHIVLSYTLSNTPSVYVRIVLDADGSEVARSTIPLPNDIGIDSDLPLIGVSQVEGIYRGRQSFTDPNTGIPSFRGQLYRVDTAALEMRVITDLPEGLSNVRYVESNTTSYVFASFSAGFYEASGLYAYAGRLSPAQERAFAKTGPVKVYPSPARPGSTATLELNNMDANSLQILDAQGRRVAELGHSNGQFTTPALPGGMYWVLAKAEGLWHAAALRVE